MNQLVTLENWATVEEILDVFHRDGAVIIRNLLEPQLLTRLRTDLDAVIEQANIGTRSGDPIVEKFGEHEQSALGDWHGEVQLLSMY